jgi:hypothetical protein
MQKLGSIKSDVDVPEQADLQTPQGPASPIGWADIEDKPSMFPPDSHSHVPADVTGTAVVTADPRLTDARTPTAHVHPYQPLGYVTLANDTLAQALATNINTQLTVTANRTLTTTVPAAGVRCSVVIVTSGTVSYTITFGTGFKPVGTLATGTVTAKAFVVDFLSNGTYLRETGRTTAMTV